jgi:hypothetical protein
VLESRLAGVRLAQATPQARARLLSSSAKYGGTLWTSLPMRSFGNSDFCLAVRSRLGLPPSEHMPRLCACGFDLRNDQWHFLSCPRLRSSAGNFRHNLVLQTLAAWVRRLNGTVLAVEPRGLSHGNEMRPDLLFALGNLFTMVDVTIRNSASPSRVQSAQRRLASARQAERAKTALYAPMARSSGADFSPLLAKASAPSDRRQ